MSAEKIISTPLAIRCRAHTVTAPRNIQKVEVLVGPNKRIDDLHG
jgi:hypothetical protein